MARVIITSDGRVVRLRPVRLYRLTRSGAQVTPSQPASQSGTLPANAEPDARRSALQPIPSGQFYRVVSPPEHGLVTPSLATELNKALDQFAQANGFSVEQPLTVLFRRGTMGLHRLGRAVDIYAVGGKSLGQWVQEWNAIMRRAAAAPNPHERTRLIAEEKERNLGYKLYKSLQAHGGWAQPPGYPAQLFGPWTRSEGPHQAISDRMLYAHRDHIHVAK
ncbi:MAG: 13E12 repeat family protein [Acidobacteria bacterium]|nr:13E12 repeat family protein [Acidobacteriota bacterium]